MKKNINIRLKMFGAITILFIIIINIVISFAYIRGKSENIESVSTIAFEGAILKVVYSGNSENIVVSDILPGFVATKSFAITSDFGAGNEDSHIDLLYQAMLIIEENDFNNDYIKFSLTADEANDEDGTVMPNVSNVGIAKGSNYEGIIIGSGKFYSHNKTHAYTLNISYPDNGEDQTDQIGNKFAAYVVLSRPNLIDVTFDLDGGRFTDYKLDENSSKSVAEYALFVPPVPVKKGYTFKKWSIVSGNSELVDDNSIKLYDEPVTLLALYEKNIFPVFTYLKSNGTAASYLYIEDSDYDWRIKFLESGTVNFEDTGNAYFDGIDVFLVGGGAGGQAGWCNDSNPNNSVCYGGAGGAGGYTNTVKGISIEDGVEYPIVIGAGAAYKVKQAGDSTAFGQIGKGANGSSGGSGPGGSNGSGGQGTTTGEFGVSASDPKDNYSPGGSGGGWYDWIGSSGSGYSAGVGRTGANSGRGGNGDSGGGWSGIVVIRNARET